MTRSSRGHSVACSEPLGACARLETYRNRFVSTHLAGTLVQGLSSRSSFDLGKFRKSTMGKGLEFLHTEKCYSWVRAISGRSEGICELSEQVLSTHSFDSEYHPGRTRYSGFAFLFFEGCFFGTYSSPDSESEVRSDSMSDRDIIVWWS